QFDFWIGDWDLTWNDSLKGINHVTKEYQSCVIHENFNSFNDQFLGQSFSVYNKKEKMWQQTWIDNQNSYLLFNGGLTGKEMILNLVSKDSTKITRMRFTGITENNFDWFWESSADNGKNWKTLWQIHYKIKN
ncbi:MAG: hypothetical protein NTV09_10715, partial [Bacteroidetes bacterium]|nr:hypothetical protein [Bacteroidota bacterium]